MKKILLVIAIFTVARANAQIVNPDFQHWQLDTSHFAGFVGGQVPGDVFPYYDPVGWTSTNSITGDTALGGLFLVTPTTVTYTGDTAVQLVTDTLKAVVVEGQTFHLVVPGMVLNGTFNASGLISTNSLLAGATITPGSVTGAGQPFTQRLGSFSGYYQYTPVFDSVAGTTDSCVIWAALRNGSTVIANAEFKSAVTTSGYTAFSVPFVYLNCETPDTLVVLLSSSNPKFASLLSGSTGLSPGSVLLVDDLSYDTLPASQTLVFAANDYDTVATDHSDTINVLGNDVSCSSLPLTVSITTGPANGTATVLNDSIVYTPTPGFSGNDSILYTDTDPNNTTSSAWAKIYVKLNVGISEANEIAVRMYPVPATDNLHLQFANAGKTSAFIYDVVGNLISVIPLTQNDNNINVSNFANGVYGMQLVDESNTVIARTKFVVNR